MYDNAASEREPSYVHTIILNRSLPWLEGLCSQFCTVCKMLGGRALSGWDQVCRADLKAAPSTEARPEVEG